MDSDMHNIIEIEQKTVWHFVDEPEDCCQYLAWCKFDDEYDEYCVLMAKYTKEDDNWHSQINWSFDYIPEEFGGFHPYDIKIEVVAWTEIPCPNVGGVRYEKD